MKIFNYTCQMCGKPFQSTCNTAKYCVYCRDKVQLQRNSAYRQKKEIGETKVLGSMQICPHCGSEYKLKSPAQKCCTECQKKLSNRKKTVDGNIFSKENYDQVRINVPIGQREVIKSYAKSQNLSVNRLMYLAFQEYMKNHPDSVSKEEN